MEQGLFSMNRICQLCGIAKITFKNYEHPDERFSAKYEHLKNKIRTIIRKNSSYGIRRIKAGLLDKYKIHIGRDALSRLLRIWGLQLRRKTKKRKRSVIEKILISLSDRANLLIRIKVKKAFQALTSDITEIWYNHGKDKAYLAVHKDVFGQMVYGFELGLTMEARLVISSLKKACQDIVKLIGKTPDNMLVHQDQGSQYTSYEYVNNVLKNNLKLSYSTPGTPTDNPGQESFFGRFKEENQDELNEIENFRQLKKFISNKMNYYNNKRIHTSIGYTTPLKFTKQFINQFSLIGKRKWFRFYRT